SARPADRAGRGGERQGLPGAALCRLGAYGGAAHRRLRDDRHPRLRGAGWGRPCGRCRPGGHGPGGNGPGGYAVRHEEGLWYRLDLVARSISPFFVTLLLVLVSL